MQLLNKNDGFTILELLIAAFMTVVVASAALAFFLRANQQCISQEGIADMQQNVRASVQDIVKELRMAGYNVTDTTIPSVQIDSSGALTDTLSICRDTFVVKYYIDFTDSLHPNLIKEIDGAAEVFADEICNFDASVVGLNAVKVSLTGQSAKNDVIMSDDRFNRKASQTVYLRN
jgi:Tfp pilus assembly protein PilE